MSDKSKKDDYVIIEGPIEIKGINIDKEKEKIEREKKGGKWNGDINIFNTWNDRRIPRQ